METNGTQTFIKATSARRLHMTSFPSLDRSPLQGGDYHNIDSGHDDHRDVGETQIPTALIENTPWSLQHIGSHCPIVHIASFNQNIVVPKVGNILVIISVVNHTPLKVIILILSFLFSCQNQINS